MISTPSVPAPTDLSAGTAPADAQQLLAQLEDTLLRIESKYENPASLYQPVHYLMGLKAKRVRPLLLLLAHQGWAKAERPALELAASLEYFHNFTLVHDDIMDHAPTRRGQPTVHSKWDTSVAILTGDVLFAQCISLAAGAYPEKAAEIISKMAEVARVVCEGQALDMEYTAAENISVDEYLEMIAKKTAWLIGGAMWMGATAGGATAAEADALFNYGVKVGTAFQVMDDLLDTYADEASLGKKVGGDIIEGKNTYLWLRAVQKASPPTRKELNYWRGMQGMDDEKVAQVRRIYDELGIPEDTRALVAQFYAEAEACFAPLAPNQNLAPLSAFLQHLIQREN